MKTLNNQINPGQPLPEFSLEDFSGETFSPTQLTGQKMIVLVFNRGFM